MGHPDAPPASVWVQGRWREVVEVVVSVQKTSGLRLNAREGQGVGGHPGATPAHIGVGGGGGGGGLNDRPDCVWMQWMVVILS